ncbi:FirrV-1-B49 [Feldmannia irregularis virus a]|uniref:FirrV-1-B49 n=1 Tax=Feldmannia irregularis virus a TaxID=231992 RepID=Q6XLY7_9PHYC|nr:FirrV-1-B49 [Feldmannia irregularis virus a]AAR26924.1 FirrV-1-B49 [Feldmannia irregularis virus a]
MHLGAFKILFVTNIHITSINHACRWRGIWIAPKRTVRCREAPLTTPRLKLGGTVLVRALSICVSQVAMSSSGSLLECGLARISRPGQGS